MDAIVHRPDLPLYPGSTLLVGMGLWNNPAATMMIESLLFALGIWVYFRQTRPMDKIGIYGFWGFVVFLYLIYLGNIFGPPPPNSTAIAVAALLTWLFVPWAWWFDAHRVPRNGENPRNQV